MKEQIKTPEKELNKMEISNQSDTAFKTLFIRMLKELSEDLSSIKNIQPETRDTLTEIKNNLRETTEEWMKLRINSMIGHIRNQKTTNHNRKKRESPKMRIM